MARGRRDGVLSSSQAINLTDSLVLQPVFSSASLHRSGSSTPAPLLW